MTARAISFGPNTHPVVGHLEPFRKGVAFQTFETDTMRGLVRVTEGRLDILGVAAIEPGRGDFSRFLADCKAAYKTIGVWEILNPDLRAILAAKGFRAAVEVIDGDESAGMRWDRSTAP